MTEYAEQQLDAQEIAVGSLAEEGIRHDWSRAEIETLFELPFNELMFRAQIVHRRHFDPNRVQLSRLLSIKTGGCPEDCAYCPQSAEHDTDVLAGKMLAVDAILDEARRAKEGGAARFCMGAAWRNPKDRDIDDLVEVIEGVRHMGLQTCMTLGMLTASQAQRLSEAGLDYYNHNIDTSPEFYKEIITTRTYEERLETLENVRRAGMKVCCGGIVGMGEGRCDRAGMIETLANLPAHPESVPINMLMQVEGTPLYGRETLDILEFVRTIAVARIVLPRSVVRLSAGRELMSDEAQAMCFLAGANSIFVGDKLLTTDNPGLDHDEMLLERLGIQPSD
ncbi:MAG: biotin synthase BioB [Rickettsiales bacterium]|jgi:biotin synthase